MAVGFDRLGRVLSECVWNGCTELTRLEFLIHRTTLFILCVRSLRYRYTDHPIGSECPHILHNFLWRYQSLLLRHPVRAWLSPGSSLCKSQCLTVEITAESLKINIVANNAFTQQRHQTGQYLVQFCRRSQALCFRHLQGAQGLARTLRTRRPEVRIMRPLKYSIASHIHFQQIYGPLVSLFWRRTGSCRRNWSPGELLGPMTLLGTDGFQPSGQVPMAFRKI